jgi:uncharacterized protein
MKSQILILNFVLLPLIASAQIQVKPLPSAGYEKRIKTFIDSMHIVDTHEHLMSIDQLKKRTSLDFMVLLHHYSADDIKSAGMTDKTFSMLLKDSLPPIEKWKILEPYWESSKNTAYNRVALLTAEKLFNIKDINESTVDELSARIRKAYEGDWIKEVVVRKCKADFLIQDWGDRSNATEQFRYLKNFDSFVSINSRKTVKSIGNQYNINIISLDDLENALDISYKTAIENGIVGVKSTLAYSRILKYENVKKEKAQEVLNMIINAPDDKPFPFNDVKPLQDYMMHRSLDRAGRYNLPVAIHTGLQTGNGNIIENSKPTHLVNIFSEHPYVNFVLFHGGYPYGEELATIAKYFRNAYIDMCWLHVISPSASERYLHEWLETVPASKIMGFGGDYLNVDNTYGHLLFAKQVISKVLIEKVRDGYFTEKEAIRTAQMILHDNAVAFYKLK